MLRHALLLTVLTLTLAACAGPYVDPSPREVTTAGPEAGLRHTGIAANHMTRIDPQ
ncbi:hypothetical protein [Azospirillum sp. TSO22-1]|uniref:hypothetical protein n=1 Tax=Azospirillum sp. TSO22-1 TaxID=716789 RepID=UPI001305030F|nr:hypothetical protein [Azospirillum sp. TSO22-1]